MNGSLCRRVVVIRPPLAELVTYRRCMLFLIDSNVAIASDPVGDTLDASARDAINFFRLSSQHHHDIRTHPASLTDFRRDGNQARRSVRLALFRKHLQLSAPPAISDRQREVLGDAVAGSNDDVDQLLLAAIVQNAAQYLVTQDQKLHAKARRMDVADRVLSLAAAIDLLNVLHTSPPSPPPAVNRVKVHQLNLADPIFDQLKVDYSGFVGWFERAARAQRDALLIDGGGGHAGVAILKDEPAGEYGLPAPQVKISTFKVAEGSNGQKYGELLLKAIFDFAHSARASGIYLTLFSRQQRLSTLLGDFGFHKIAGLSTLGENVLAKDLRVPVETSLTALEAHVRFGPPALFLGKSNCHVVPIVPAWHRILFPDAEPTPEPTLFPEQFGLQTYPFGNALRKAYLCHSPSRLVAAGDTLLFYRSGDLKAVQVIGVCEKIFVSQDPDEIAAVVGQRTVYSLSDIGRMAARGPVVIIRFRQDRILQKPPIDLSELIANGVLKSWPQSLTKVPSNSLPWLTDRVSG